MEEIIQKVLRAEEEAEEILKEARARESEIRSSLEREISQKLEKVHADARQSVDEKISDARKMAEAEYRKSLEKAVKKSQEFLNSNEENLDFIVQKIVTLLSTPEYKRS